MGYTWEAWALAPQRLVDELATPSVRPDQVRAALTSPAPTGVLDRWDEVATALAAAGGAPLVGDVADHVVLLVRALGRFAGSVAHTSSGGAWFREELMATRVGGLVGPDVAAHLVDRALAGLVVREWPGLGWLTGEECARAAAAGGAFVGGDDDEGADDVWVVLDALARGAREGGLVTLYL